MIQFIRNLFGKEDQQITMGYPAVPLGQRVYAIGDIHGRLDLFDELLEQIQHDHETRSTAEMHLILLGDLVDRGPDSAGVIARAMELRATNPNIRFLAGNHEEVFLSALTGDAKNVRFFARIGGRETILSYGMSYETYRDMDMESLAEELPRLVPQEHVDFVTAFENAIVIGDYAFVHAGIRPGVPVEEQENYDLRWIRGEFLSKDKVHDKMIVHGHTISEQVDERKGRIGIDTGAYDSGVLTAIGLEGADRWFLQTGMPTT